MNFLSSKELLQKAMKEKYAVGAFNFQDLEIMQAIVDAAKLEKSPLILQTSEGAIEYAKLKYLHSMARVALEDAKIPIALHLDHGKNFELTKKCIKLGYKSVMIDASEYGFEKNVKITRKVVEYAHRHNASVEAELGRLKGVEDLVNVKDRNALLTDPYEAKEFVNKTGCDVLAIAIGTSHGAFKFKGKSNLDFDRLEKIRKKVKIPLVLHGASGVKKIVVKELKKLGAKLENPHGVSNGDIKKAIKLGISKINVDTDIRLELFHVIRDVIFKQPSVFDIRKLLGPAREEITKLVREKIRLFGSNNKI